MLFIWTAASGWAATVLLCAGVAIPYYVRSNRVVARSMRTRMRPHYWIGFLIPAVAFVHAWIPMSSGHIRSTDPLGLVLATTALLVMLGQVALGVSLRLSMGTDHVTTKRVHFWTLTTIAGLVAAHIILNRA